MEGREFRNIAALSARALEARRRVSYGWTHAVVAHLESLGVLEREGNRIRLTNLPSLLDHIAAERPLIGHRFAVLPVRPEDKLEAVASYLRTLVPGMPLPTACGLTAARRYGADITQRGWFQFYVKLPPATQRLLSDLGLYPTSPAGRLSRSIQVEEQHRMGLELFAPDRPLGAATPHGGPVLFAERRQVLLDCAGMPGEGHGAVQAIFGHRNHR